jgi:DNA-binding PadR family transcriptional regulator
MSAKHAILGLVIERPGYGYELARRLQERCGAWEWEASGVYSALDQLERDEHIHSLGEKRSGATARGAPRVIYEATLKGRDFFRDWLLSPTARSPVRQELDLKILLSGPEDVPRLIDLTWAQEQQCIDDLRKVTRTMQSLPLAADSTWHEARSVLQRDAEIKLLQVRIEWLQETRTVMKQILERSHERWPK